MKKEYDFEKAERKKHIIVECAFNILLVILGILAALGLLFCILEFDIPAELGVLLYLGLLIGGGYVYLLHKNAESFFNRKAVERHLKESKFDYLTDEQIHEIILEISHLS